MGSPLANTSYFYDKSSYVQYLKPRIEKSYSFEPRLILQFEVVLPFYLPFPSAYTISVPTSLDDGRKSVIHLVFRHIDESVSVYGLEQHISDTVKKTRVEVVVAFESGFRRSSDLTADVVMNGNDQAFSDFLYLLNGAIDAYIALHSDISVYRLTPQMCNSIIQIKWVRVSDWGTLLNSIFVINKNIEMLRNGIAELTYESADAVMNRALAVHRAGSRSPFSLGFDLFYDAFRLYKRGHYMQSVVTIQMSFEMYIRTVYNEFLKMENKPANPSMRYCHLVMTHIKAATGNVFDVNVESSDAYCYWQYVYHGLRNRIVHEGYEPSDNECRNALLLTQRAILTLMSSAVQINSDLLKYVTTPI